MSIFLFADTIKKWWRTFIRKEIVNGRYHCYFYIYDRFTFLPIGFLYCIYNSFNRNRTVRKIIKINKWWNCQTVDWKTYDETEIFGKTHIYTLYNRNLSTAAITFLLYQLNESNLIEFYRLFSTIFLLFRFAYLISTIKLSIIVSRSFSTLINLKIPLPQRQDNLQSKSLCLVLACFCHSSNPKAT